MDAAEIDRHLREGLIQRNRRPAESLDASLFAQCLVQGFAHDDSDIFHCVMFVDFDIPLACTVRSKNPCLAKRSSIWSKNRMDVSTFP